MYSCDSCVVGVVGVGGVLRMLGVEVVDGVFLWGDEVLDEFGGGVGDFELWVGECFGGDGVGVDGLLWVEFEGVGVGGCGWLRWLVGDEFVGGCGCGLVFEWWVEEWWE